MGIEPYDPKHWHSCIVNGKTRWRYFTIPPDVLNGPDYTEDPPSRWDQLRDWLDQRISKLLGRVGL